MSMSEESAFLLIGLLVLAFPVLAIVAFAMTLGLRRRVQELEERVRQLAGQRPVPGDAVRAATPSSPAPTEGKRAAEPVREAAASVPAVAPVDKPSTVELAPARPEPAASAQTGPGHP